MDLSKQWSHVFKSHTAPQCERVVLQVYISASPGSLLLWERVCCMERCIVARIQRIDLRKCMIIQNCFFWQCVLLCVCVTKQCHKRKHLGFKPVELGLAWTICFPKFAFLAVKKGVCLPQGQARPGLGYTQNPSNERISTRFPIWCPVYHHVRVDTRVCVHSIVCV